MDRHQVEMTGPQDAFARCWSAAELPISHETIYQHIYADKTAGGALWKNLRCQKKRKRYAGGTDRRGQIVVRRPINQRPADVETRRTVGHWEGDTVIGARHTSPISLAVGKKEATRISMGCLGSTYRKRDQDSRYRTRCFMNL